MQKQDNYGEKLWRWLDGWGFNRSGFPNNPFALYQADKEQDYISYFFVDRPYLHQIIGDPKYPQTAFLMAKRGEGKTATREMTAYECKNGRLQGRALAVRYFDFGQIIEQVDGNLEKITVRQHVTMIVRLVLKALADDVPPTYFDGLEPHTRQVLASMAQAYADPMTQIKLKPVLGVDPIHLNWADFSYNETLYTLTNLITQIGRSSKEKFEALYILVDCVDETFAGADGAVALLKPLVSQIHLFDSLPIAFKFFLPVEVGEKLEKVIILRRDRLYIQKISWDRATLANMVAQRLSYYSNERIADLADLCTTAAKHKAMQLLIDKSGNSPRTLLRLCHELIQYHVQHSSDPMIDAADIRNTIADFERQVGVEKAVEKKVSEFVKAVSNAAPGRGIYLDNSGHVWVDGQALAKPLSPKEFALLKALYEQAGSIVSRTDLIAAVWPSAETGDELSLRKLIDRLRQHIAPKHNEARDYFIKNAKGRGYWLNTNP